MNMLDVLELDWHTFRTCLPVLRMSVHRLLPGLSNFIAAVQVLVSWLMCSHMGNWELLLFSLRSCCIAIAVCIAILWLCCAPFTGKRALSATSFLCWTVLHLWKQVPYAGLEKTGKAMRLVPSSSEWCPPGLFQTTVFSTIFSQLCLQTWTSYINVQLKVTSAHMDNVRNHYVLCQALS